MSRSRMSSGRSGSGGMITRLVFFGILIGIGFMVVQRLRYPPPDGAAAAPTLAQTAVTTAVPTFPPIYTSTPYPNAVIYAPKSGINATIIDVYLDGKSWDVSQLGMNVGHLQGTGWFGKVGNIALAGHVEMGDGRPGVFKNIDKMEKGDPIILQLGDLQQDYKVTEIKRVKPDDLSVLTPTTVDRITLITCDIGAYNFLSNVYLDRIVVVAERVQSNS